VWLAEVLLQQTQADRVVPFYERILGRYPTIKDLADSTYDEFFLYYQGLGYYSRARNLLKTANIVSRDHAWVFPMDKKELKKLPGVGEYTARAILAFGYGEPVLAWDTNLETIFSRYYRWAKNIKLTEDEKNEIERDFQNFVSEKSGEQWMGVRGGGTVWAMTKSGKKKSEANTERVWLPTDAFDTFGSKSMENGVWENMITRDINNALMDWARTMEPKTANLLERENYIFTESEFYKTNWSSEVIEKKVSTSFPTPDARIIVILHQDHRVYYSLSIESYSPFILPASEDRDTRKYVQDFFRNQYALELSVRPVHKKWITKDGQPYIAVNAQIQAGDASIFAEYGKSDMKTSIEILYSL
jgi:endonuclease III